MTTWQDCWTFRIVDQETGAAVPGVPVSVVDQSGRAGGYWVSDVDGVVRIQKHDQPRLRLRVGLRNEETIELDARSLPDDPIPLAAPADLSKGGPEPGMTVQPAATVVPPAPVHTHPGQILRFARLAVLPQDRDLTLAPDVTPIAPPPVPTDPSAMRYAVLFELEALWQSLGTYAGDTLYSVSLGPGDEVKLVVSDGRWRKKPDARERPLQIVAKMVGARQIGDTVDAVPLDPVVATDLAAMAADTVQVLADRTMRMSEGLSRRPLGITEHEEGGTRPPGATIRTLRNMRAEGVLTYHFVEPAERYRVIVRAPRMRPALLVPFRLPNIATPEVLRRFGHILRRNLLDRRLAPEVDDVLSEEPAPTAGKRLFAHMLAHLPYYSAMIIAAGDPAERFFALAKLRDPWGRPLTDLIENVVVGRVGNYAAFPLRSADFTIPEWRAALTSASMAPTARGGQEMTVTLPLPGIWLRSELFPALVASDVETAQVEAQSEPGRWGKRKRGG